MMHRRRIQKMTFPDLEGYPALSKTVTHRVGFSEVDPMHIVWFGRYAVFFEEHLPHCEMNADCRMLTFLLRWSLRRLLSMRFTISHLANSMKSCLLPQHYTPRMLHESICPIRCMGQMEICAWSLGRRRSSWT